MEILGPMKIDLTNTRHVLFFAVVLPALSIGAVLILGRLLQPFENSWLIPYIDDFGFIGAYVLLFSIFNNWLWKLPVFKQVGVVVVPDLSGRWTGHIVTSHDSRKTKIPAVLEIRQSFSSVSACLYSELSTSVSIMADFLETESGRVELHYEYHNEPNEKAPATMHGHDGLAKLWLNGNNKINGSYYTTSQHGRGNFGSLSFGFESEVISSCFEKIAKI